MKKAILTLALLPVLSALPAIAQPPQGRRPARERRGAGGPGRPRGAAAG